MQQLDNYSGNEKLKWFGSNGPSTFTGREKEELVCVKCGRELPACLSHVVSVPDFRTDPGFERFQVVKQILVRVTEANLKIQIRIIIRLKFERAGSVDRI